MLKKIEAFCLLQGLLHRGMSLIVACSGGPDSLALLDVLSRLAPKYELHLMACYVHHGIRTAADQEVDVVRQAAQERQCAFTWAHVDVPALAAARHESMETTGRTERYRILREAAASCGAEAIAVAHHQNDQAETVLQHVLRGSGIHGITGMRPCSGDIIRPFLAVTRFEIEAYVKEWGLQPCEDETNRSTVYTRNRIRWELLPAMAQYNPAVVRDLNRLADIARADDDFLEAEGQRCFQQYVHPVDGGGYAVSKKVLLTQPLSMQRRLVRLLFKAVSAQDVGASFYYTEQLLQLARKDTGRFFQAQGVQVYTTYTDLCFIHQEGRCKRTAHLQHQESVIVDGMGRYQLGVCHLEIQALGHRPDRLPDQAFLLDAAALKMPLELRYRRSGDWIYVGRKFLRKTIKKLFIDQKIPVQQRETIPFLCQGHEVLWMYGGAVNPAAAVTDETQDCFLCVVTENME